MPVQNADLSLKQAAVNNNTTANGGRLTDTAIAASLFPDVTGAERTAGIPGRYRKVFFKNEAGIGTLPNKFSDNTLKLLSGKVYLENISASGDYYLLKAATPTDTQNDIVDSGWAGTGYLDANVSANATTLDIRCELNGSTGELFQNGGVVCITDYNNGTGNREFVTLDNSNGVTWGGGGNANLATLTFTATPLQFSYNRNALAADRTADIFSETTIGYTLDSLTPDAIIGRRVRIKSGTGAGQIRRIIDNSVTTITTEYAWTVTPDGTSVYEVLKTMGCMCVSVGDIITSYDNVVATTAGDGDFTPTGNLKLFPIGTRDDSWTLLFSSSTAFSITGDHYGVAGGGPFSKSSDAKPTNGSSFYFQVGTAGWSGTWTSGDTLEFDTVSSSKAVWLKEVVPAGIDPHAANSIDIGASGDTV